MSMNLIDGRFDSVQRAFDKQAEHYDFDDRSNPILVEWRKQVYQHLDLFLLPGSRILELNSGTGIDALHLVRAGHHVDATDISPGMIQRIQEKINLFGLNDSLTATCCSYELLNTLQGKKFDYVFSNFGGLNCCQDLEHVTRFLPYLLNHRGLITWVIMPPVCLWELSWVLQGKTEAFRRLKKNGTIAHLEGEYFSTYYHSLSTLKEKLGPCFQLRKVEGLGALSPPPGSAAFALKNPGLYSMLKKLDGMVNQYFPFNRWADHFIATFQFT